MNPASDSGRHPVNIGHLVMGVAFAGLVVVWALIEGDVVADDEIRWLMPGPWVLAGVVGLVAATLTARRRSQPAFAEPSYVEASYAAPSYEEPTEPTTSIDTEPTIQVPEATTDTTDNEEQK